MPARSAGRAEPAAPCPPATHVAHPATRAKLRKTMRRVSFAAGVAVVVAAQLAPLDDRFWTHMLQHLLIADLGPLLLCLGRRFPARPALALPAWAAALG